MRPGQRQTPPEKTALKIKLCIFESLPTVLGHGDKQTTIDFNDKIHFRGFLDRLDHR